EVAGELEARNRQLHVDIGKVDDGLEERCRQGADTEGLEGSVQATAHGALHDPVVLAGDGSVLRTLRLIRRRRQAEKVWCAVVAAPVQERRAAEDNGRTLGVQSEQHRQYAEKHVISNDNVDVKLAQSPLQRFVLGGDRVHKQ